LVVDLIYCGVACTLFNPREKTLFNS